MGVESVVIGDKIIVRPELDRTSSLMSLLFENIQFNN